jgi:hypothetical protein
MFNLTKYLVPLLIIVATPIVPTLVDAKTPVVVKPNCFRVSKNAIVVKRNINPTQLETLKVIKVSRPVYEQIILNYSLENNIKKCLENSQPINGFRIPMIMNKPGMVSFDTQNRYISTATKFKVVESDSSYTLRAKGYVDAYFSESKGYIITSNMNRY